MKRSLLCLVLALSFMLVLCGCNQEATPAVYNLELQLNCDVVVTHVAWEAGERTEVVANADGAPFTQGDVLHFEVEGSGSEAVAYDLTVYGPDDVVLITKTFTDTFSDDAPVVKVLTTDPNGALDLVAGDVAQ